MNALHSMLCPPLCPCTQDITTPSFCLLIKKKAQSSWILFALYSRSRSPVPTKLSKTFSSITHLASDVQQWSTSRPYLCLLWGIRALRTRITNPTPSPPQHSYTKVPFNHWPYKRLEEGQVLKHLAPVTDVNSLLTSSPKENNVYSAALLRKSNGLIHPLKLP